MPLPAGCFTVSACTRPHLKCLGVELLQFLWMWFQPCCNITYTFLFPVWFCYLKFGCRLWEKKKSARTDFHKLDVHAPLSFRPALFDDLLVNILFFFSFNISTVQGLRQPVAKVTLLCCFFYRPWCVLRKRKSLNRIIIENIQRWLYHGTD